MPGLARCVRPWPSPCLGIVALLIKPEQASETACRAQGPDQISNAAGRAVAWLPHSRASPTPRSRPTSCTTDRPRDLNSRDRVYRHTRTVRAARASWIGTAGDAAGARDQRCALAG
jgi:hypothetical protein